MEREWSMHNIRTDLAMEAKEMYVQETNEEIEGVKITEKSEKGMKISTIHVKESAASKINKKSGTYITVHTKSVIQSDANKQLETAKIISKQLNELLTSHGIEEDATCLVIGLGNWNITPDALGPMAIDKLLVTNHLFFIDDETLHEGYRRVAAMSPGVMGTTGMETSDIVLSVIERLKPDFVIVVDALASKSIERINETIQITDTGIHPGSGVGNKRKELSKEVLHIPVFAIGVPTVVDAVTIVHDTMNEILKNLGREAKEEGRPKTALLPNILPIQHENLSESDLPNEKERKKYLGMIGALSDDEKRSFLQEILTPSGKNLIVTPKEVDQYMEDMAHLLAQAINACLHEKVKLKKTTDYTK
ncbi:GPR endopeptidase [Pseudogracilibacillus sp. ICA-222130]|uniref:GPR endopeptidase n=1 Tax=Pseudogracilibacillus sp. ICA-222130 TaxID=3134655 RepID=UPI004040804E